ncbi:Protein archease-like [Paramicrosporidium saccamoebae]|uniref:Protein archease-like n=1 Tax=Paramicrosporidium saccamoebae TaxID=1246581 RepID=A0A2H9TIE8_9FUNG|nr:Protein archease-like [Paramicrosporidium saccamoebae]
MYHTNLSRQFSDLEHTADIQIHSWGGSLEESFIECAYALYDYMTDRSTVNVDSQHTTTINVTGDGVDRLLYNFLDELLFRFSATPFLVAKRIEMRVFDVEGGRLEATCFGEPFESERHPCGTEVKAITTSNLQISPVSPYDIYIIFDI